MRYQLFAYLAPIPSVFPIYFVQLLFLPRFVLATPSFHRTLNILTYRKILLTWSSWKMKHSDQVNVKSMVGASSISVTLSQFQMGCVLQTF